MENKPKFKPDPKLKLMDQIRQVLRYPITLVARSKLTVTGSFDTSNSMGARTHPAQMGKTHVKAFWYRISLLKIISEV